MAQSTLTAAFKDAGYKLPPLKKRVWLWLKDHPGKTPSDVCHVFAASGCDPQAVRTQIWELHARGMIKVREAFDARLKGYVRELECLGEEYELLPRERKLRSERKAAAQASAPPPVVEQPKTREWKAEQVINALTPAQAREVYNQLKEIFE